MVGSVASRRARFGLDHRRCRVVTVVHEHDFGRDAFERGAQVVEQLRDVLRFVSCRHQHGEGDRLEGVLVVTLRSVVGLLATLRIRLQHNGVVIHVAPSLLEVRIPADFPPLCARHPKLATDRGAALRGGG